MRKTIILVLALIFFVLSVWWRYDRSMDSQWLVLRACMIEANGGSGIISLDVGAEVCTPLIPSWRNFLRDLI